MVVLWVLALVILGVQLATLLPNLFIFPVLAPRPRAQREPARAARASILVPARDEALNLPRTLPSLLVQGAGEVIVLDDGSTDGTAELLAGFCVAHPQLVVVSGAPLPEGWTGKMWACHQLAQRARGELLVFTDADVTWEEGALDAIVAAIDADQADLLSVWPRQETRTLVERLSIPWVDLALLSTLPYLAVRRHADPRFSAANGQLMAWRREAYARVGGHAALRAESVDDVLLARLAKANGARLLLALGPRALATRMYAGGRAVVEGIGRHLAFYTGGTRASMIAAVFGFTLTYGAWPWLALVDARWLVVGGLATAQHVLGYAKARRNPLEALLHPLSWLPTWAIAFHALSRWGRLEWKGRTYRRPPKTEAAAGP